MPNRAENYAVEVDEVEQSRVSFVDILLILVQGKRIWLASGLLCGIAAFVISHLLTVKYQAEADILPPQQSTSSASILMGQMGNLLGMGANTGLGLKDPSDLILAILRSRSVADGVIQKFDLGKVYKQKDIFVLEAVLASHSNISTLPTGVIAIKVDDPDPKMAAAISNGYIDELYKQNGRLAFTESAQRRLFFEHQLSTEKDALEDAEVALKQTQLKTGVIELQGQTDLALRSVATLRAQISSSQVQLQSLLTSETANNPDVIRLHEQIRAQNAELAKLQSSKSQEIKSTSSNLATSSVPELGLDYVRKLREVKYHETLFDLLARQYEAAKIDEAKEAPAIQVIDKAVPPHFEHWPPRTLITVAGTMLGLFLGAVWVILQEMFRRQLSDLGQASKWSAVRRALWS